MKILITCITLFLTSTALFAQHGHSEEKSTAAPLSFASVLNQQLSDPELKDYTMTSSVLTIIPGGTDTVAHRHDCEIFGYVLEGSVNIGLEYKEAKTFTAGQMFYERRNIIHSFTHNASQTQPAKVLLIFIIKNGRAGYTRVHPEKK